VHRAIAYLVSLACLLLPALAAEHASRWRTVWHVSQAVLVAGNAADVASSWGKTEANPLVRTGPRFGFGSLAIKAAAVGGALAAQHYVSRKSPEYMLWFAPANFGAAAILGVVAAHNAQVPRQ